MAENKTKETAKSVAAFLDKATDAKTRRECDAVTKIMKRVTGSPPRMWGPSMVGFGRYHYKYESGREGDSFVTGFSPRKGNLTMYVTCEFEKYSKLMKKLGKHTTGKSCLYVKTLDDIDLKVLEELIEATVADTKQRYRD